MLPSRRPSFRSFIHLLLFVPYIFLWFYKVDRTDYLFGMTAALAQLANGSAVDDSQILV